MKKEWKNPEFKNLALENTEEDIVDCPLDIDSGVTTLGCPPEHDETSDLRCNYPGCKHKRNKKSNPPGRCKCHNGVVAPQS